MAMASPRALLVAAIFMFFSTPASASGFLDPVKVTEQELEAVMLDVLAGAVRADSVKQHLVQLEERLQPLFNAVPKEADGTLSHAVVRYVLDRFFSKEFGWSIRGLEDKGGQARNDSSPLQELQTWAPEYLQDFLEKLMGGRGINLREVAIFAAALEHLIQQEEQRWLRGAYDALWLPQDESEGITAEKARKVLLTYMMIYMMAGQSPIHSPNEVERLHEAFRRRVRAWNDTEQWINTQNADVQLLAEGGRFDFQAVSAMAEKLSEHFSQVNDRECSRLKDVLLGMESQKPGRVRLTDFYRMALADNAWEFTESIEYLRSIGATDEADPTTPLVLIPNYVAARPNCLPTSSFYVVCCKNQCEDLMSSLEHDLQGPLAEPHRLAELVASLPSESVPAPRELPAKLLDRLDDIAKSNDGKVPLHGRLFAQWMHHAYPRECPYPHKAGTATARFPEEWMQETGEAKATVSMEEMQSHVSNDTCRLLPKGTSCDGEGSGNVGQEPEELPWDRSEELLVQPAGWGGEQQPRAQKSIAADILLFAMLSTAASGFVWVVRYKDQKVGCGLTLGAVSDLKEDRAV